MILGMTPFTAFHVLLSLIGIVAGFPVVRAFLAGRISCPWTGLFLATTLATTVTGFLFPFTVFTPAIGVGLVSLAALVPTIAALYVFRLQGPWRSIFVAGSVFAFYLNFFVLVVQAFLKVPALNALAPNGNEPPFAIVQGLVLLAFVTAGYLSLKRLRMRLA